MQPNGAEHHARSPWTETLRFDTRHTIAPHREQQPSQTLTAAHPGLLQHLYPNQPISLSGISTRAFLLGITFCLGLGSTLLVLLTTSSPLWRIPFFLAALSLFHFLEFWTTAARNTSQATVSSFLLAANWPAYPIAHTAACLECLATNYFFPRRHWAPLHSGNVLLVLGLLMVAGGQVVRSLAMLHAGESFNHTVQVRKAATHTLVTSGIYGVLRHPSYFGFFYWGLGTQAVLGNVFCFMGYGYVLWMFFSSRVKVEEKKLVEFFGDDYVQYRKRVGTMMPFVG